EPFALDTMIEGIPLLGNEPYLLATRIGDSVDVRAIQRYDTLRGKYVPPAGGDSVPVTEVVESFALLVLDVKSSLVPGPVTLEAYDVSGPAGADTAAAVLAPRFAPERLLGSLVVQPRAATDTTTRDSLRVPIDAAALVAKLGAEQPVRLGFRVSGADDVRLRFVRGLSHLSYDPSADTTVAPILATPRSLTPDGDAEQQFDEGEFTIVVAGTPAAPPTLDQLTVGGLPARRALLQFQLPPAIADSATIVRATLELTQAPVRGFRELDTLVLLARPVLAGKTVTDPFTLALLSGNLSIFTNGLPDLENFGSGSTRSLIATQRISPADSGVRSFEMAQLFAFWRGSVPGTAQRAIVLRSNTDGTGPLAVRFFSSEAPPSVRPRLRITYIPSAAIGVP
ncbi:MAG TPA: hypothetical protein VFY16_12440, partial [Gemmatimonadaceae bacterium]|nr:hypothetical protein [Gemmatimonadaceae bacterium]